MEKTRLAAAKSQPSGASTLPDEYQGDGDEALGKHRSQRWRNNQLQSRLRRRRAAACIITTTKHAEVHESWSPPTSRRELHARNIDLVGRPLLFQSRALRGAEVSSRCSRRVLRVVQTKGCGVGIVADNIIAGAGIYEAQQNASASPAASTTGAPMSRRVA